MFFTSKRKNKKIANAKSTIAEKRPPRINRFKKNLPNKSNIRKIKITPLLYFIGPVAGLTIFSIMLIFIHDFLTQTQYFSIQNIEVDGTDHLRPEKIINQAGIAKGDNLLGINLRKIRKRILTNPWVKEVRISREIPDVLRIDITEYKPEAIAEIENETYLLNREGWLFKTVNDEDPKNLPFISGISYTDVPIADFPASSQFEAIREVLELGRTEKALIPAKKIRQIYMDRELGLTLEVFEPAVVIQIGYGNYSQKYRNLKHVLAHLQNGNESFEINAVDLRDLDQIVVTPTITESPRQG